MEWRGNELRIFRNKKCEDRIIVTDLSSLSFSEFLDLYQTSLELRSSGEALELKNPRELYPLPRKLS